MNNPSNFDTLLEQGNQTLIKRSYSSGSKDHIEDYLKAIKKNKKNLKIKFLCVKNVIIFLK